MREGGWAVGICVFVAAAGLAGAFIGDVPYAFVAGWALRGIYRMQTVEDPVRFPPTAMSAQLATCAYWASAVAWAGALVALAASGVRAIGAGGGATPAFAKKE